ncbi:hypothetical protein ACO0LL_02065 [Undibacterium sp. TC4M20W]|uniref:hypothetical protein n=1 Tax=unclassified Undibacterium TaxID=2630295 RepID=UPI003BEFA3D2
MEIGTAKNYFYLLKISAKVYVYLKYIYDILKNDMSNSTRKTQKSPVGLTSCEEQALSGSRQVNEDVAPDVTTSP